MLAFLTWNTPFLLGRKYHKSVPSAMIRSALLLFRTATSRRRGAETRLCRAETRLGACWPLECARPWVVLCALDQPCFHRVLLDVSYNPLSFAIISDPVVVALCLPNWF